MIKWKNKPEGNCPVQAEGYFMNHYFYFRARYEEATIEFAKNYSDYLSFKGINYFLLLETPPYKAGWLPICVYLLEFKWNDVYKHPIGRKEIPRRLCFKYE